MRRTLGILLLALLALRSGRASAVGAPVARFALVIGYNRAPLGSSSGDLQYADDDAVQTHRLLLEAGVASLLFVELDEQSRRLYPDLKPDGPPRLADVENGLGELSRRMGVAAQRGASTELLFFYSGHGDVAEGEGYVAMQGEALTRTKLFELLARSPATHNHVFVDACKSYFVAFDKGPGGERRPYEGALIDDAVPARLANTGFVLSTRSDRESHEWERYQGGILSYELRSALRGAADADRDGHITYAEIGAFLTTANASIQNPRFRPDFMVRPPGQNLQQDVLRWPERGAVRTEGTDLGHVYLESVEGERLLDAHAAPGQALELHVPAARPLFVRRNDDTAEYVVEDTEAASIAELSPAPSRIAGKGAVQLAFEKLFGVPFGKDDVQRFERTRGETMASELFPVGGDAPPSSPAHAISGAIAIAAGAAALGFTGLSVATYLGGQGESEIDRRHRNDRIIRLDIAAAACYAGAAVAGIVYWRTGLRPALWATSGTAARRAMALGVEGRF